jgi:HD superfamily phosphohydrolase
MQDYLEIRDPVHGFIYRESHERDLIDTKLFQRLRSLHQLALAYLVYPGATHTRFDHSLGAFHVAGGLAKALVQSDAEKRLVRLASLLHDVGHGPFSHVAEPILQKHSSKAVFAGKSESKIHELISAKIILENTELKEFLSDRDRQNIVGLLNGSFGHSYLHEIVSGPIDADKQDYLLRDSYFTGVKYGIYDQERLKNTLRVHEDNDDMVLAISIDGMHALEQFVLAKYYMTTQVYRHRIRLITDQMIERAIFLGIEQDNIGWLRALYSYDGTSGFIEEYLQWNDERLMNEVLHQKGSRVKDLFDRLRERRLFKCIFDVDQNDFPDPSTRNFVFAGSKDFYKPLEEQVAKQFGFDPNHVIAYGVTFNSATKTESQIPVLHKTKTTLFDDESALFKSVDQQIREQHFHIYAPVEYKGDEKQKKKKYREYKEAILKMIQTLANPQQELPLA